MLPYALRRLLLAVPVLIGASVLVFGVLHAAPGDPVRAIVGGKQTIPESTRVAVTAKYDLDASLPRQYVTWAGAIATGDLGESYENRRPVADILRDTLPNSIRLALVAVLIEAVLGIGAGIVVVVTGSRFLDALVTITTAAMIAIPIYVIAVALQYWFGVRWGVLPISGTADGWASWILPGLALAAPALGYIARLTRSGLDDELRAPYAFAARARGLTMRQVTIRHSFRAALPPIVTFIGIDFGMLLGGAILVEQIFNIPGVGRQMVRSIRSGDNPTVLGLSLVMIGAFLLVNLVVDLVVARLDPRTLDE